MGAMFTMIIALVLSLLSLPFIITAIVFLIINLRRKRKKIPIKKWRIVVPIVFLSIGILLNLPFIAMEVIIYSAPDYDELHVRTNNKIYWEKNYEESEDAFQYDGERYVVLYKEDGYAEDIKILMQEKILTLSDESINKTPDKKKKGSLKIKRDESMSEDMIGFDYNMSFIQESLKLDNAVANIEKSDDFKILSFFMSTLFRHNSDKTVYSLKSNNDYLYVEYGGIFVKEEKYDEAVKYYLDFNNYDVYVDSDNYDKPDPKNKTDISYETIENLTDIYTFYLKRNYYGKKDNIVDIIMEDDADYEYIILSGFSKDGIMAITYPELLVKDGKIYMTIAEYTSSQDENEYDYQVHEQMVMLPENVTKELVQYSPTKGESGS